MANTLIYALAWSQVVVPIGLMLTPIVLRSPAVTIGAGIVIEVYFFTVLGSAGWLSKLAGCDRFDEGSTSGCILWGTDVSSSLYSLGMTGWLGMFVLPLGVLLIGVGVVQAFGWMGLVKAFGLLFLIAVLYGFVQGILGGGGA